MLNTKNLFTKLDFEQDQNLPKDKLPQKGMFLIRNIFEIAQIVFFRFSGVLCEHQNKMELPTDVDLHFFWNEYEELSFPLFLKWAIAFFL